MAQAESRVMSADADGFSLAETEIAASAKTFLSSIFEEVMSAEADNIMTLAETKNAASAQAYLTSIF